MRKLNYLLHSVTVINFALIGKLFLRYKLVTIIGLILLGIIVPYFHNAQPVVFQKDLRFKVTPTQLGVEEKVLLGENTTIQQIRTDVLTSFETYEFKTNLAQKILKSQDFEELEFVHPERKNNLSQQIRGCADEACRLSVLQSSIGAFYDVTFDSRTNRFNLKINSLAPATTKELMKHLKSTLEEVRIETARRELSKQIALTQDLLAKSKSDLESKGGLARIAQGQFLDAQIAQQKETISALGERLINQDSQNTVERTRFKESRLVSQGSIGGQEKMSYEKRSKIGRRIEEIRQNIAAINSLGAESRTKTDDLVLVELQKELELLEKDYKRIDGDTDSVGVDDSFISAQMSNKNRFEFDYKVSSVQVKKLKSEHEAAIKQLDILLGQKSELENQLITLKPDLDYIKLLETKLVGLKYRLSSISSDVLFEQHGNEVSSFRRNTLVKIFTFSVLLMAFVLFLAFIGIYLLDDRIFEELEVEKCIDDLPIVGHAPYFD